MIAIIMEIVLKNHLHRHQLLLQEHQQALHLLKDQLNPLKFIMDSHHLQLLYHHLHQCSHHHLFHLNLLMLQFHLQLQLYQLQQFLVNLLLSHLSYQHHLYLFLHLRLTQILHYQHLHQSSQSFPNQLQFLPLHLLPNQLQL